jgi:hypothetical protein
VEGKEILPLLGRRRQEIRSNRLNVWKWAIFGSVKLHSKLTGTESPIDRLSEKMKKFALHKIRADGGLTLSVPVNFLSSPLLPLVSFFSFLLLSFLFPAVAHNLAERLGYSGGRPPVTAPKWGLQVGVTPTGGAPGTRCPIPRVLVSVKRAPLTS